MPQVLAVYVWKGYAHSELAVRWPAAVSLFEMIIYSLWSVKCTVHSTENVTHVTYMLLGCYMHV